MTKKIARQAVLPAISGTTQGVLVDIRLGVSPTLPDKNTSPVCVMHFSTFKKKKKRSVELVFEL